MAQSAAQHNMEFTCTDLNELTSKVKHIALHPSIPHICSFIHLTNPPTIHTISLLTLTTLQILPLSLDVGAGSASTHIHDLTLQHSSTITPIISTTTGITLISSLSSPSSLHLPFKSLSLSPPSSKHIISLSPSILLLAGVSGTLNFLDFRIKKLVRNVQVFGAEITDMQLLSRTGTETSGYTITLLLTSALTSYKVLEFQVLGNIVPPFEENGVREGKGYMGCDCVNGGRVYVQEGKGLKVINVNGGSESLAGGFGGDKISKGAIVSTNPILLSPTFLSTSKTPLLHLHPPSSPPFNLNLQPHTTSEKTLKCYKVLESGGTGTWIVGTNSGVLLVKPTIPIPQTSITLNNGVYAVTETGIVQRLNEEGELENFITEHVRGGEETSPLSAGICGLNEYICVTIGTYVFECTKRYA
ncbi:hypothetical protein TL16_g09065 [Triparma laevis f. inornata]|uniref:Uncharacterized protein n=2 Tax=Triparma laevis TaxID=1534972 RepID=A0A9W7FHC7_9STRA|nr:hypothetical protein TL16_g09065 [Triparma laevis f. inornata]GMI12106.1 hypothetical protein TrLO_g2643 [Triparma laevis f. longispina]